MVMLKHQDITIERIEKYISPTYFTKVNLYGKLIEMKSSDDAVKIQVSQRADGVVYKDAIKLEYKDTQVGTSYGPSWSTYWFKVIVDVPMSMRGKTVHFIWNSNSEALIWVDGVPTQGLTGGSWDDLREDYKLIECAAGGEHFEFYVEVSCNGMFGVGQDGLINPPDENRTFKLDKAHLIVKNKDAYELYYYFQMLYDISKNFPKESIRKRQAIWTANEIINKCNIDDVSTFKQCTELAKKFFADKNGDSQTRISAIGGCHIDLVWLWFRDITIGKAARSFSTQVLYMDYYPEYKFVQSQAKLYQWTKDHYPELYQKMKEKVATGQMVATGGTWTEMDGNLPSGESFIRQFLFGQRFFKQEFGKYHNVFWLPDTFGYSAQLPQVIRHMGIQYFITQKLSWNNINKFPHSTFIWQGLDGSEVLTHFPPADTYNSAADVKEVVMSSTNNKDIDRCNESMLIFGHGDGGGGPNVGMIERLNRMKDTDGIPKVDYITPDEFFARVEPSRKNLLTWAGELYFELHRGTYTSQAETKRGNRLCEIELHSVEMLVSYCDLFVPEFKPPTNINSLWEPVLFNQFHDALPGSSIGRVYQDILKDHQMVLGECKSIITKCLNDITQSLIKLDGSDNSGNSSEFVLAFNANDFEITRVIEIPKSTKELQEQYTAAAQISYNGLPLGITTPIPANGFSAINISTKGDHQTINRKPDHPVTAEQLVNGDILVNNKFISLKIGKNGNILSIFEKSSGREVLKENGSLGNRFTIYEDVCAFWTAWDTEVYALEKPVSILSGSCKILESGPLRVVVQSHYDSSNFPSKTGSINQTIVVHFNSGRVDFETDVDWHENQKLLKVDFDTNIRSPNANYEIQFGHIARPTHYNSSWDVARFEVVGHKWADLSEYDLGMSLLNDCKYGYAIHNGLMALSLLKSPKAPDDNCDMGTHKFTYSIFPHRGSLQSAGVIKEGYSLNNNFYISETPFTLSSATHIDRTFISSNKESVIVDTVKKAEDGNGHIVRVYESFGGKTNFNFISSILPIPFKSIIECNGLEEINESSKSYNFNDTISIGSFQVKSFRFISN